MLNYKINTSPANGGGDHETARARGSRGPVGLVSHQLAVLAVALGFVAAIPGQALAFQQFQFSVAVETGPASRVDMAVDASLDLTGFLGGFAGSLNPAAFQVVEVNSAGTVIDPAVLFQFDPAPGYDPALYPAGNLVFVMNDTTPAFHTRHYRVLFDVVGACGDCPGPPAVLQPTTVDSLMYQGQMTYRVTTPRAEYYYHMAGAGLASIIDTQGNDWVGYQAIPGSRETGEYRGIPNMVGDPNPEECFFHPGFTTSSSTLVGQGPLKVTIRSTSNHPTNVWILLWEFYPTYARMTMEEVGTSNDGAYWFLYEGTPGGTLDPGDLVIRSDGTTTNAADDLEEWEVPLPDPQWLAFHDTSIGRYLFLSDDVGDDAPDSFWPMGYTMDPFTGMTVMGLGRVLPSSPDEFVPRMTGAGRSFTLGLGENIDTAASDIIGVTEPLTVTVGAPEGNLSPVGEELPLRPVLNQNYPNPFNPSTTISFDLPARSSVNLSVYNTAGRLVRTLITGNLASGSHTFLWDGRDQGGRTAPSGIYLYRLITPERVLKGKMTMLE